MKWFFLLLISGFNLASASSLPITLEREEQVANVVLTARAEVRVIAPLLRSSIVTNALRRVLVEHHVRVLILADADLIQDRSSYIPALSVLASRHHPVQVRLLRGITRAVLIVDQARVMLGPLVTEPATFGLKPTRLLMDTTEARVQTKAFQSQWQRAKPWSLELQNPRFATGGKP
jgi:hypothetical protein